MPSPPILNIPSLIAPIPGNNPAGTRMTEVFDKIKEFRTEEDPENYPEDDPRRQNPKRANWSGIIQLTTEKLATASKDLLLVAYLTEALLKVHGFLGLRDGVLLFRELIDKCWDRLLPAIEDNDVEVRAGPFNLLDDPVRGLRFPTSVRMIPIMVGKEGSYCYLDRNPADRTKPPRVSDAEWEKAVRNAYLKTCQQTLEDVNQCLEYLNQLTEVLKARMGQYAPGLTSLRPAVEGCQFFLREIIRKKEPEAPPPSGPSPGVQSPGPGSAAAPAPRNVASRAEAYRLLAQAAALLKELEPHSPIPYLVERAVELGNLPFPDMIKALIRNADVLSELNRELGIKGPAE
jgi:type VI secretion system protein ImpA